MSQLRTACFASLALLVVAASAPAQVVGNGVIDQAAANRQGLNRSWFSQVDLDASRGRVLYANLHVNDDVTFKVFEVRWADQMRQFSSRDLDHLGRPVGDTGAEGMASRLANQLREEGQFVEIIERDIPQTTLYVQTDRAMLHAFDGETGATRWSVRLGRTDFPCSATAASNDYVATLNGSTLYLLDAETGLAAQEDRFITGGPAVGPALSDYLVMVPKQHGMLEGYFLDDPLEPEHSYKANGRALVQPMVGVNTRYWPADLTNLYNGVAGSGTVSWSTDVGELYVADAETLEIRFRFETGSEILSPAMYRPADPPSNPSEIRSSVGRWYLGSINGYAYCVSEEDGDIMWRYSTGQTVVQPVVPLAAQAYVVTQEGTLYCLNSQTGEELWWHPNVERFLGGSERRTYCIDNGGNLMILDARTGGFLGSLQLGPIDFFYTNPHTDRIYLGTTTGLIQCLHESDSNFPLVHAQRDQDGITPPGAGPALADAGDAAADAP